MFVCRICRFVVELDDVVVRSALADRCICLRCFSRATDTQRPVPRTLARDVTATLYVE